MTTSTFTTHYLTGSGTLMIFGDNYLVLVRVRDGLAKRFTYAELGFQATHY